MKCVICKNGETKPDTSTVTLESNGTTLIVKSVPAEVCENCGEEYIDEQTTAELLQQAEDVARTGVPVEIREYLTT